MLLYHFPQFIVCYLLLKSLEENLQVLEVYHAILIFVKQVKNLCKLFLWLTLLHLF